MTPEEMKQRTKAFALRIIRLIQSLPKGDVADVIGRQLLKSGTSVGANYRASCRSRSDGDFLARMGVVEEEADESLYWMELMTEVKLVKEAQLANLMKEADEILSIVVASINTVRARLRKSQRKKIRNLKSEI